MKENAAVIIYQAHARIGVWAIGMQLRAEFLNDRINFHGRDLLHAVGQCRCRIRAGAGAENERVLKRSAGEHLINAAIERLLRLPGNHALVADAVDVELIAARQGWGQRDLVIGRPVRTALQEKRDAGRCRNEERGAQKFLPIAQQQDEHTQSCEPENGRERKIADKEKRRRPRQTAQNVESISGQRRRLGEKQTERTGERDKRRRHKSEDEREQNETLGPSPALRARAEVEHVGANDVQLETIHRDDGDEREEQNRKRREAKRRPTGRENTEPHTEEGREENEIREVAEIADVGRNPADAEQLEKKEREGKEKNAQPHALDRRSFSIEVPVFHLGFSLRNEC